MPEADRRLAHITTDMNKALRYGVLWESFTIDELANYAAYKTKRAMLLMEDGDLMAAYDDVIDACNHLRFTADLIKPMPIPNKGKEESDDPEPKQLYGEELIKHIARVREQQEDRTLEREAKEMNSDTGTEQRPADMARGTDGPRCNECGRLWRDCLQHRRPGGDAASVQGSEQYDKPPKSGEGQPEEGDTSPLPDDRPDQGEPVQHS